MKLPVYITGPESTGKTTLCGKLAEHFGGSWVPEYAREYISGLARAYRIEDVEQVARNQINQIAGHSNPMPVFFDTGLIVTKVWFEEVYNHVPAWFLEKIPQVGAGIYLLCQPDLPWEMDEVRENPNKRDYLYNRYKEEITAYGFHLQYIQGFGEDRLECAIKELSHYNL